MQNTINTMKIKNKTNNKKAITPLISTILIIGIGIVLLATVGILILNAVKKPLFSPTISCSELLATSTIKIEDICYNETNNEIKLKVERSLNNIEINLISFELSNNEKTEKWLCGEGCGHCAVLQPGESKFYYLSPSEQLTDDASLAIWAGECLIGREQITSKCS